MFRCNDIPAPSMRPFDQSVSGKNGVSQNNTSSNSNTAIEINKTHLFGTLFSRWLGLLGGIRLGVVVVSYWIFEDDHLLSNKQYYGRSKIGTNTSNREHETKTQAAHPHSKSGFPLAGDLFCQPAPIRACAERPFRQLLAQKWCVYYPGAYNFCM